MLQRQTSVAAAKAVLVAGAWLFAGIAVIGCGQRGPLMLPKPMAASASGMGSGVAVPAAARSASAVAPASVAPVGVR